MEQAIRMLEGERPLDWRGPGEKRGTAPFEPYASNGLARRVRAMVSARSLRRAVFKASLFSDPAWDILLGLFLARIEGRRVSISAAGRAGKIPLTTALRWINALEHEGLLERAGDIHHGRRVFLNLTGKGVAAMEEYFRLAAE